MTFMKGLPLLLLVASLCSHAALQPDRTRIVFNANDKATSLRVDNRSDKLPYLAYSWL
ncbi:molecular chaperone, partial [Shigella boydii]